MFSTAKKTLASDVWSGQRLVHGAHVMASPRTQQLVVKQASEIMGTPLIVEQDQPGRRNDAEGFVY